MALLSQTALRGDPPLNHNFLISLIDTSSKLAVAGSIAKSAIFDVALGGFMECTGLESTLQIEEYKEGGTNSHLLKFPTRTTWTNIILKKGISAGTALWDWHHGFALGKGRRRDGLIILLNDLHVPNNIWYFRRGLPAKYTGPAMNAAENKVAVEAIEIAHEGIYQVPGVGYGALAIGAAVKLATPSIFG